LAAAVAVEVAASAVVASASRPLLVVVSVTTEFSLRPCLIEEICFFLCLWFMAASMMRI
jgi:hypothetical protein